MANAAGGKFPDEGPLSLVEMVARNRIPVFSRESHQSRTISTIEMPDGEPNAGLRAAIDMARDILPRLNPECLGNSSWTEPLAELPDQAVFPENGHFF